MKEKDKKECVHNKCEGYGATKSFFMNRLIQKQLVLLIFLLIILFFASVIDESHAARIKDLSYINGVRTGGDRVQAFRFSGGTSF